jgi:hypothetical protein
LKTLKSLSKKSWAEHLQSVEACVAGCVVLFAASLVRYWARYDPRSAVPWKLGPESLRLAYSLYSTGQFANPFVPLATGPSAHLSPVFPAFLALLMKVFGDGSAGMFTMQLAAALILSLQIALFPVISRTLGMGTLNGFLAACIWIVAKVQNHFMWESFYGAVLLGVTCCYFRLYLSSEGRKANRLRWILGCLMGLSIFVLPSVAPVFAVWLVWEFWRRRSAFWKESFLPLILLPALMVTPWTIRNYVVFHHVFFIRDDLGEALSASNNDCAEFGIRMNELTGCFQKVHPNVNVDEAKKVLELGEFDYNKMRLSDARHWIAGHPARFAKLTAMRFVAFWIPNDSGSIFFMPPVTPPASVSESPALASESPASVSEAAVEAPTVRYGNRRIERSIIYLMTLLSGVGLVILYRQDIKSMAICTSCLAVFPLVYYLIQFEDRYRYPIMWITFLLGSVPITTCARRLWNTFFSAPAKIV